VIEAVEAARKYGTIVSYDLNYRDSLWSDRGGREAANRLNRELLTLADVVFGVEGFEASLAGHSEDNFRKAAGEMISRHPNLKVVATTLRDVHSASRHSIGGMCLAADQVVNGSVYENVDVLDRVGSGDAFAAGLIYRLLAGSETSDAIETALAAAVMSLASLGDGLSARLDEVERLAKNSGAAPVR